MYTSYNIPQNSNNYQKNYKNYPTTTYYNNGDRSDKCPMDLIDKIVNYEIKCPNFHDKKAFDWNKLD